MEFSDRNPEDLSGGYGDVPPADDFSFSVHPAEAAEAASEPVPDITAPPDAGEVEEVGATERPAETDAAAEGSEWRIPSAETALDMPGTERESSLVTAERFVAGGEQYVQKLYRYEGPENDPIEMAQQQGCRRKISPEALAAEGLSFDQAEVVTESSEQGPYTLTIETLKTIPELQPDPKGPEDAQTKGPNHEVKVVEFTSGSPLSGIAPVTTMDAYSYMVTGDIGSFRAIQDDALRPIKLPAGFDNNTPLLRLDEVRALIRAMEQAQ